MNNTMDLTSMATPSVNEQSLPVKIASDNAQSPQGFKSWFGDIMLTSKINLIANMIMLTTSIVLLIVVSVLYNTTYGYIEYLGNGARSVMINPLPFLFACMIIIQVFIGLALLIGRIATSIRCNAKLSIRPHVYHNIANIISIIGVTLLLIYTISMFLHISLGIEFFYVNIGEQLKL